MPRRRTRRTFLGQAAASVAAVHLAPSLMAARPRERVRLAFVGVWNRGKANLSALLDQEVVALCDVDARFLGNAQREVAKRSGAGKVRTYSDFRRMLDEEERNLDGVVVSTPDHTHAPAAADALRRGLHVYCEKPLTHSVREVRALQKYAREGRLATQMGTQIHATDNYRRVVELIRSGAIGDVRAVHVWCGKGWSDGRFRATSPVPDHLDWDLWQGPVAAREYCDGLHPADWRRFWDYGGGTLADMACHYVDLVHWALELDVPEAVSASGPELHEVGAPASMRVQWRHPARAGRAAVDVHWYDGSARPEVDEWQVLRQAGLAWGAGHLWIGSKGMLVSDYGRRVLLPKETFADHEPPEPTIASSIGHHAEWVRAIEEGTPTTCDFAYSGALTETVLLGNVAFRSGREIAWDGERGGVRGGGIDDVFLERDYRAGWEL